MEASNSNTKPSQLLAHQDLLLATGLLPLIKRLLPGRKHVKDGLHYKRQLLFIAGKEVLAAELAKIRAMEPGAPELQFW